MNKSAEYLEARAETLGAHLHKEPSSGVSITGYAALTPLGDTQETFEGMLNGQSGVVEFDANNFAVNVAAPVKHFDPLEHFDRRALRGVSYVTAMADVLTQRAALDAGLIQSTNEMLGDELPSGQKQDRHKIGSSIGSGIGPTPNILRIYQQLYKDVEGLESKLRQTINPEERSELEGEIKAKIRKNSERVGPLWGLEMFPEEVNSDPSMKLGYSGPGISDTAACATGLSNAVESVRKIKEGESEKDFGGGVEAILTDPNNIHIGDIGIASFAALRLVLSTEYFNILKKTITSPEESSRPYDRNRDGFVLGEGGAVVLFERSDLAAARGANVHAEVVGYSKSLDGKGQTDLDVDNVARTILEACENRWTYEIEVPDVIFAHATATKSGDRAEAKALYKAFGKLLQDIPITANKSNIGHLAGGAGSVNLAMAIEALRQQQIPHILNLVNPRLNLENPEEEDDEEINHVVFVRNEPLKGNFQKALILGYGFGGNNAAMLIRRPKLHNLLVY